MKDGFDIDFDGLAKFFRTELIDGGEMCCAGVIDKHIDAFPAIEDEIEKGFERT